MIGVCKFCGCTENKPCRIPLTVNQADDPIIAFPPAEPLGYTVCGWLLDDVCTAPACVEKAYPEACALIDQLLEAA